MGNQGLFKVIAMNSVSLPRNKITKEIKEFVIDNDHPCVMAQSVVTDNTIETIVLESNSFKEIKKLYAFIEKNALEKNPDSNVFTSLIAVFPKMEITEMEEFEIFLWDVLYKLNTMDSYDWDPSVSEKLNDNNYSFSIAGTAFYIVGMFPQSQRKARRMPYVSLVFNLHSQFEKLREMGAFDQVKKRIRSRDRKLQGSINPMLKDFGTASEAMQYSGMIVDDQWKCPFFEKPVK